MNESPASADMAAKLASANQAGAWLGWFGIILALIWWTAAGFGLYALNQQSPLMSQPASLLVAAAGIALLPGFILIFAGFLARQNRRTHDANALLLQASSYLLAPAKQTAGDIQTLAEATRYNTSMMNQTSANALKSLTDVTDAMAAERVRAETVGYAMADNARDLTTRLSEERIALETLSRALHEQVALMGETLPRQANALKVATQTASQDVAEADERLGKRIESLQHSSSTLATRLIELDTIARDSAKRAEALQSTISRIEDRLGQTQKTVETAERAGSMAVDAATQTSDALKDAISAALDGARDANREIADKTRLIQETSQQAMDDLRKTGAMAAATAARVHEQSLGIAAAETTAPQLRPPQKQATQTPEPQPPEPQTTAAQAPPEQTPNTEVNPTIQVTAADIGKFHQSAKDPAFRSRKMPAITEINISSSSKRPVKTRRVYNDEIDPIAETRPIAQDTDLFEPEEIRPPQPAQPRRDAQSDIQTAQASTHDDAPPKITRATDKGSEAPPMELGSEASPLLLNKKPATMEETREAQSNEWRDIIADIADTPDPMMPREAQAAPAPAQPREATAMELISRLQNSGIPLPTTFRHRDKKKIAEAARKDKKSRHRAIRNAAGVEVDRVYKRLRKDNKLLDLAQRFVDAEESEALKALDDTSNKRHHASSRLSAYLLVDAALEPMLRN